jgi:hypothetical protein
MRAVVWKSVQTKFSLRWFFSFLLCGVFGGGGCRIPVPDMIPEGPEPLHYTVEVDSRAGIVRVSMDWSPWAHPTLFDLLPIQGKKRRRKHIHKVRCLSERSLVVKRYPATGGWVIPAGCATVGWEVALKKIPPRGYMASRQDAVKTRKEDFVFLPGAAVFLMPQGKRFPTTVEIRAAQGPGRVATALTRSPLGHYRGPPTPYLGLAFVGIGRHQRITVHGGGGVVEHVFLRRPDFSVKKVAAIHRKSLRYISAVLGRPSKGKMTVFWFGLHTTLRTVGGSSGYRTMAVNYLRSNPHSPISARERELRRYVLLFVLLHEQFHISGVGTAPLWLKESLAQYYALKSLRKSDEVDAKLWRRMYRKMVRRAPKDTTLIALQRRFERKRDKKAYGGFYTLGLRFLFELDRAIQRHSSGKHSLDNAVRLFLDLTYGAHGKPYAYFWQVLAKLGGASAIAVAKRYLGPPPDRALGRTK